MGRRVVIHDARGKQTLQMEDRGGGKPERHGDSVSMVTNTGHAEEEVGASVFTAE